MLEHIDFVILEDRELEELDNIELLAYKHKLREMGEEVKNVVVEMKATWRCLNTLLKQRMIDLEIDILELELDKEEDLLGSGEGSTYYFNLH